MLPSGNRNTLQYNGDLTRVRKDDSSGTTKFVWDSQNVLMETNASDATQAVYTSEASEYGRVILQRRGSATALFHFDVIGSTNQLTDTNAAVLNRYVYEAFGAIRSSSGATSVVYRYVGQLGYEFDIDLDQYHVRRRVYEPILGRWLSKDPFLPLSGRSVYLYVRNAPTFYVDPGQSHLNFQQNPREAATAPFHPSPR